MKHVIIVLLTFIVSQADSCNTPIEKNTEKEAIASQKLNKKTYDIVTLNGKNITKEQLYITVDTELNSIYGFSGCNTFSCKFKTVDNKIEIERPMASKMYCKEKIPLEDEFLKALALTETKVISNNKIVLKNSAGKELILGKVQNNN